MKITEPILKREQFSYQKQYENAIASSELLAEKYIVKVPFSGQSRGDKIFHVEATSEEIAVQKVKKYKGELISEETIRDDRNEDRDNARCYGLVYTEHKVKSDWYKDKSNFPCMLIANLDGGNALVWVHYQIDGIAYDVRDNGYRLVESTNWRKATKQEILDNIKGI
jgi:hypothetical protein